MKTFHVYILASRSRALYIGITSDLTRRIFEHRQHLVPGHTAKYRITRLVHYEAIEDAQAAICREKQLKGWRRDKKVALIQTDNPTWEDLAADWYDRGSADVRAAVLDQQVPHCVRDDRLEKMRLR